MNLPKVSVLIPCFNHENYVVNCLESIQYCYAGNIEVIICDDKSKDNSVEIIESYLKEFSNSFDNIDFIFIKHEVNKGVSETLNDCISRSSSDYIYTIASDDFFLKDGISKAMKLLLDTSSDAVISDCIVVDDFNNVVSSSAFFDYRKSSLKNLQKNIAEELVFNWVVPGPALLQKKTTLISLGGFNKNLIAEDRDYYLRLLATKKVIFNKEPVSGYRVHARNLSKNKVYLSKANKEFAAVNFNASETFNGFAKVYLKTYWLDLNNIPIIFCSNIRRLIKVMYLLWGRYG